MAAYHKVKQNAQSVTMPREYIRDIAYNTYLDLTAHRVWMLLSCVLDTERYVMIDRQSICTNLIIDDRQLTVALEALKTEGYIIEGGDTDVFHGFILKTWF